MKTQNKPVSIIIPAFNEEFSLSGVLENISTVLSDNRINGEIIVVDDGSNDNTATKAESSGVKVVRHEKNLGYGAALKSGIKVAHNDLIIIIDADGTYPESDIPIILKELDNADMVIGSRTKANTNIPTVRRPAKWILKVLAQLITGKKIPDLNSGMRGFHRELVFQYLNILPDKFSFTTTITVAMLSDNYKVRFVPIDYRKRVGKSKIVPWDFFSFALLIMRLSMYFNPLRVSAPISIFFFSLGFIKSISDLFFALNKYGFSFLTVFSHPVISITSMLLFITGLQILLVGMVADGIIRRINNRNHVRK